MTIPILSSTFFLTLLLMVGLFFFIRASVKDRTKQVKLTSEIPVESLLSQLEAYFTQRAYQIASVNPQQNQITFEGFVRPSWFLAIFLSFLAAIGLLCFAFVLSFLYQPLTPLFFATILLCPLVGIFYWKQAGRVEKVLLEIESSPQSYSLVTVTAHRDELIQLQEYSPLKSAIKEAID
ncbi:conserved hypothetical protein [Rippkaea orientalis PCC 8801]|uniref:Cofactor assembly of complex C subunit B n=1 Tax=Rippkaea orientalis (strain PCC 8801 / RF-1) TaxID=41431 RepID=B7JX48_RIPO1|nr:cofactor assembly of complex C subunit B [Rippkaea orientalis]ACK67036.1 conserved hypothetical protein [Rippkaea orientalis PCC 8801]